MKMNNKVVTKQLLQSPDNYIQSIVQEYSLCKTVFNSASNSGKLEYVEDSSIVPVQV